MQLKRMTTVPGIAVATVLGVQTMAVPSARADDLSGPYLVSWSDGTPPTTWSFGPCGPGCLAVSGNKGWKTEAHLVDGRWVMDPIHNTVHCGNGTEEHATARGTFDPTTLAGTSVITYPEPCPGDPKGGVTIQFTLAPAPPGPSV